MKPRGFVVAAVRARAPMLLAVAGILAFVLIGLLLRLPQRIQRGEKGQAAIQMLDAMRRPFLGIKDIEATVLRTHDAEAGDRALATALDSASSLLNRYQELARYSAPLLKNVVRLSRTFQEWVAVERELVKCIGGFSSAPTRAPSASCLTSIAAAADGFLKTLGELGAGETPIHADIDDGRAANRILLAVTGILFLHLAAMVVWEQRAKGRREAALLRAQLRAEEDTRALERALSESLAKVLSGFISICASCKRVRSEDNQWTPVETYVTSKTEARFSHGICPECRQRLYGNLRSPRSGAQSP